MSVLDKIYNIQENKCVKCPASWNECDYWGEWDEGCRLDKNYFGFCIYAFLPKSLINLQIYLHSKREGKALDFMEKNISCEEITRDKLRESISEIFHERNYKILTLFKDEIDIDDTFMICNDISTRFLEKLHEKDTAGNGI